MENQLREARSQLDGSFRRIEFLTKELVKRDNKLRKTYIQLLTAKEKETKIRATLLEKTNFNRVSDHEIKDKFLSIRQKAQAISRSSTYDLSILDPAIRGYLIRCLGRHVFRPQISDSRSVPRLIYQTLSIFAEPRLHILAPR
jgi:hypothetical protein